MGVLVSAPNFVINYENKHLEHLFTFKGHFITPSDIDKTYEPLFTLLENLISKKVENFTLVFEIGEHLGHSAISIFMKLFRILIDYKKQTNANVFISWYYTEEDDDNYYTGIDFNECFTDDLTINLIHKDNLDNINL